MATGAVKAIARVIVIPSAILRNMRDLSCWNPPNREGMGGRCLLKIPSSTGQRSVATEPQPKLISPRFSEVP
jgi:hypothetical protein